MATPADQLDQLIATTFDKVRPALADQITTETPLLAALNMKSRVTADGGLTIRRPLMYALNDTVGSYQGYDLLDVTPQGGIGFAEYEWKQFAGAITIDGLTERKNMGAAQIIALVQSKVEQLRLSFEDYLNTTLWGDGTGNSNKDMLGIQAIVKASGTLGGIDPSTEDWWKAKAGNPVDLTTLDGVKGLNSVYNSLVVGGNRPDFEFTTQAAFEAYEALAAANIRFTETKMAQLGFESIAHKTAEVVFDPYAPELTAGKEAWWMLNSRHLEFVTHSAAWLKRSPFAEPYNQDAKTAKVVSMGQFITDMRRAHAVIADVTV